MKTDAETRERVRDLLKQYELGQYCSRESPPGRGGTPKGRKGATVTGEYGLESLSSEELAKLKANCTSNSEKPSRSSQILS